MNPEMTMAMKRHEEREALRSVIQQWNANRLDLFELSEPNEELLFHGVMRFYFQEPGTGQKVATKCIRVASDATSQAVIETLIEKFRPDMRMLSVPEYALYEIHENGDERKLNVDEKPLLVQLNWHKDDREGRFLLRRIDEKTNMPAGTFQEAGSSFKRKLSKREKKQLKKQEKLNRAKSHGLSPNDENDAGVAEKLYTELPETSFTRSISNPEAVMRRRRQQKLERKLQAFRSKDGGPDTGGTLKIYGESLCRDVPYKTLLLSIRDTAQQVVKEMLAKYGLDKVDPHNFCLVQVNNAITLNENNSGLNNGISENKEILNNNNREYILDDDECPLAILMNHPQTRGSIMFHVRRRPADYHPRKRKKKPTHKWNQQNSTSEMLEYRYEDGLDRLPFFLELNADGMEVVNPKRYRIHPNVTEVGCERQNQPSNAQCLQLNGPNIQPRHCVIAHTEGIVTVTPCSRDAETYVGGQRIFETTILQNGSIVKFGRLNNLRFLDPCYDERPRPRNNSLRNVQDYYDSGSVDNTQHSAVMQQNFETTFDVDGNIETRSTSSQGNKDDTRSQRSITSSRDGNRLSAVYGRTSTAPVADNILPCVLEVREETEEAWIHAVTVDVDPSTLTFKHAPAYCLYLLARYRASTSYRPDVTPMERANRLSLTFAKVATILYTMIQGKQNDLTLLSFWLAIVTELRQFLHSDRHLSNFLTETIEMLHDTQQAAMRFIVECILEELMSVLPDLFADNTDADNEHLPANSIVSKLGTMMTTLREGRVNASLTIQIYNQVFRFINAWAFNRLITADTSYYTRAWGARLKSRIGRLQAWAERQGLEVSADCQLALISQAADLLHAPKYTGEDLASITSTCFKLNSLQLKALLVKYQPASDEPRLPHELIDNVVRVAENLADELARSDGREIRLEEEDELMITFVQPEEGFSYEVARGVPPGLIEFIQPLQQAGMCRLTLHSNASGLWTVYFLPNARSPSALSNRSGGYAIQAPEPDVQTIRLHKSNNGMGLSIVAAKGAGQERLGIYIKSVVKGGAADADGRLQAGDQLLKVDGQSLVGITQEKAAEYLVRTGPIVSLEVAKQGAIHHGLATLLSQPSPVMTRGVGGGGIAGRTNVACCRDFTQPRFGHMPSYKPPSDYLSVPDVRKKCYKIPPENELCLCEDIFQQHQAKLINCDVEDASAVESYKGPDFDSNENVCDSVVNNECCCGEGGGGNGDNCSEAVSLNSSSSSSIISAKDDRNDGGMEEITESRDKLTAEERDKVLRELEDIVTGNFLTKVRRFSQDIHSDSSVDDDHHFDCAGQLQLTSASAVSRLRGKRSSSLDTDEIVNYGKVAELTRRFSRLGEIGVITPRHYRSEPDFFGESGISNRHSRLHNHRDFSLSSSPSLLSDGELGVGGVDVTSSGDDYEVVRQPIRMVFIRPMSVSDDRLNNKSSGVVLTEVTSDGETDVHQQQQCTLSNATQNRRRFFKKSVAFDSSLSSIDGGGGAVDCASGDDAAVTRYHRLKGGCQQLQTNLNWQPAAADHRAATVNYSKSSDSVSVSNFCRSHRRYSSVDVYDQVKDVVFLDVEKTEKEFRDGLLAEKNRRREAIRDYMANKELLLMKMKSASVGGILRWNQEHQDTLLDDEEPPQSHDSDGESSSSSPPPPKDGLRRVLRTGLKGRRIRRLRKLESRSSGFALADLWRVVGNKDVPAPSSSSSRHSAAGCCSSAEPPDNHNNSLSSSYERTGPTISGVERTTKYQLQRSTTSPSITNSKFEIRPFSPQR
ncbi:afadin isoform X4 [Melanaphis sacchari]|uniref:afadin isoform X4 n=1 Tax=Melanaphis sacchari TaxID=742174 RepID=UPI000DC13F0F|nr:afadin isoform X4 [Melanaphis sacchari]